MKAKALIALRWIGILPASCLAYVLGYAFLQIFNWVSIRLYSDTNGDGGWMTMYIWPLIATGSASYFFVTIGTTLAPKYKKGVALTLLILLCMLSGAAFMGVIMTRTYSVIFSAIAQIIGAVIAYMNEDQYDS